MAIIIAAETVEGLIGYLMPEKKPEITRGIVPFSELMERWQYDFYLLPMDKDGIMQIKLMCIDNYKKDIAAMFGDTDNVPVKLSRFDAVCGGESVYNSYGHKYYKSKVLAGAVFVKRNYSKYYMSCASESNISAHGGVS